MKIMVLGSGGMLGAQITRLLQKDCKLFPRTRQDLDITDAEVCKAQITSVRPDLVINCAAYTKVDDCEANPDRAFLVNAEGVKNVAEACQVSGARIFQISTDYVFNGQKTTPYLEDDRPDPINVYGRSKLKGEVYALAIPNSLVIRTSWLFGPGGPNFVDTICNLARIRTELTVVDDQVGRPTYAPDLASAIRSLVHHKVSGIVNVTNAGACSWYEFAREILQLTNHERISLLPIKTKELVHPALRPAFSVLDGRRFEAICGEPLRPWQEALKDYLTSHLLSRHC